MLLASVLCKHYFLMHPQGVKVGQVFFFFKCHKVIYKTIKISTALYEAVVYVMDTDELISVLFEQRTIKIYRFSLVHLSKTIWVVLLLIKIQMCVSRYRDRTYKT